MLLQVRRLQGDKERLSKRVAELEDENGQINTVLEQCQSALTACEGEREGAEEAYEEAQERVQELEAECAAVRGTLNRERAALTAALRGCEGTLAVIGGALEGVEKQGRELRGMLVETQVGVCLCVGVSVA